MGVMRGMASACLRHLAVDSKEAVHAFLIKKEGICRGATHLLSGLGSQPAWRRTPQSRGGKRSAHLSSRPFPLRHASPMPWEGQAVDAEDVGIKAGAKNQAFVDWRSGSVPIPRASGGRIGRVGRPPFGLGGLAPSLHFYTQAAARCFAALALFSPSR